ncbi:uncharacterized protein [Phyllobates terribilis]|uniref:uncharacterized protein n=1 Tax=Phyllobates terribilis TaxID=111132 RepID=UPI003CCB1DC9
MAVTEEESSSSSHTSSAYSRSAGNGVHYLAKCILPSSVVLQVVYGHIRSSTSNDIIFAKETSIELVVLGEDGIIQSVCDQTVFGTIKDVAILPYNGKLHGERSQMQGKDLLLVTSDSGKLSFLTFCNAMHRFMLLTQVQLSDPGNSRNQIGRLIAVHSSGGYIAVSAFEECLALLSVSSDNSCDMIDKVELSTAVFTNEFSFIAFKAASITKLIYPPEESNEEAEEDDAIKGIQRVNMFRHYMEHVLYIKKSYHIMGGYSWNELLMVRWNVRENAMCVLSQYVDDGALAHSITEVPQSCGFALLCRVGDIQVLDITNPQDPCCVHKVDLTSPTLQVEDQTYAEDPLRMQHDGDDEGFIAASALLELQDHAMVFHDDPMSIDTHSGNVKCVPRYICSWTWEPGNENHQRFIYCMDSGEYFILETKTEQIGVGVEAETLIDVQLSDCMYHNPNATCKSLLWVEGGFLVALVEMGDGMVFKLKDSTMTYVSPIQNISPILDMSAVDYHNENEKQDQMFACCGVAPEGSLRIIRNGICVERLLKTADIYQGITGTWTVKTRFTDPHHSFLVLSFVEETRVLSVGLSFSDVTDSVGFLPDVCTLACGLVDDNLLVQIHKNAVRLCLPTPTTACSSPICTSWFPDNFGISLGSVSHNLIIVATSNPCFLIVLGIRSPSENNYEIHELQSVRLQSELSCMSILNIETSISLPRGLETGVTFVIGTHKPSVEVMSYSPGQGIRVVALGTISLTNTFGVAISGCIPQDVRFVMADRLYVLCGLRNGMLLRFEWPICSSESDIPVYLQLIAVRRIGITPVFLVPLDDSLDSDIIALSDRPWLVQTARHSLSYISISFQPSTHVTPVCSSECPKGLLFVAENGLNLVEMVPSRRLNVQKFHVGGTPRKVLYHKESRLLLVMRTDLEDEVFFSSDICCVDPLSGSVLSTFKFELGETGKCMDLVKAGNEQVLLVGTSLSAGPAVMPNGEAESTKGRLIVISIEHWPSLRRSLSFNKNSICDSDKMFSTSTGSSPDDTDRIRLEDGQAWHLRLSYSVTWSGAVHAVSPYLDRYFLASSGNTVVLCMFFAADTHKVRRLAIAKTRYMVVSLTSYFTRIAVGDSRDGVLFYSFHEESKKLEQVYGDPGQRLVADCLLMDSDTAVASDRKGSIAVLTCSTHLEAPDNASPEANLTLSCSYYMGEIAVSVRKGSFSYKLPADDTLKGCESGDTIFDLSHNGVMAGTMLGSIFIFIPLSRDEYQLLKAVQAKLAVHPLTAPILGNNHAEFRGRENLVGGCQILDGDMLAQFLELTSIQQETVLALPCASTEMTSSFRSHHVPVSILDEWISQYGLTWFLYRLGSMGRVIGCPVLRQSNHQL